MKALSWWFKVVGVIYVLLGVGFFPPINELRLPYLVPLEVPETSVAYMALIDWTFFFGLDMLIIGAFLLYAARDPMGNVNLMWLVIALEAIRGVMADIYYISRGYASVPVYVGFMIGHLLIIGAGYWAFQKARAETSTPAADT